MPTAFLGCCTTTQAFEISIDLFSQSCLNDMSEAEIIAIHPRQWTPTSMDHHHINGWRPQQWMPTPFPHFIVPVPFLFPAPFPVPPHFFVLTPLSIPSSLSSLICTIL
ncbi:uncharacterized protein LACBIDRAFT_331917 [Laccaria bicolor S238N-H82]|uniref:Predicted protein n=1 Tax=Laccaria bicolor (strain S238N-H82 / ATCC MYA-4686) TaxID=486041 RepID=B0DR17_LACBS|nr:uncharacterized protein LACBIDRAFT_331917 [Laccaria bicolor S238N-H82]EDR02985.1 predicted protein [Laccaria bicolor S238N-H82]|eukprot:XP_001886408.1 predicted protein [Laccaria bicolor S238N-H82]